MEDYEVKISQLIDNELSTEEQRQLFLFLSVNEESRKTFTDLMNIKKETQLYYSNITTELNEPKILTTNVNLSNYKVKKYKAGFYFSAAASLFLAFLFAGSVIKENSLETKYDNLETEFVILQKDYGDVLNEKIKLTDINENLINQKNIMEFENQKFLEQSKMKSNEKAKLNNEYKIGNEYLTVLAKIPTIKITEKDYLVQ